MTTVQGQILHRKDDNLITRDDAPFDSAFADIREVFVHGALPECGTCERAPPGVEAAARKKRGISLVVYVAAVQWKYMWP